MNLIIDIGNTKVKFAVFSSGKIIDQKTLDISALQNNIDIAHQQYPIKEILISNVSKVPDAVMRNISDRYKFHWLSHRSKVPFKNNYTTPQTLGVDRIALAAAAAHRFPNENVLIIDAGTCVTYDLITAKNEYLGGAISPGIQMRYKALHTFTGNLPLLEPKDFFTLTGNTTSEAIHSGVGNGICLEIDGIIDQYRTTYEVLTVILTGGDHHFLSKRLKNSIFAFPNFLMEGLHVILEYNTD